LTLIPSIYFGYLLVQKEEFIDKSSEFIESVSLYQGNYLLNHEIKPAKNSVKLVYGGSSLNELQKQAIKDKAKDFGLDDIDLIIEQGISLLDIKSETTEKEKLKGEVNRLKQLVINMQQNQDSLKNIGELGKQLLTEVSALYPPINSCAYSETIIFGDEITHSAKVSIVNISANKQLSRSDKVKINKWFKARLNADSVLIYFN
jgi:hypothetical protein